MAAGRIQNDGARPRRLRPRSSRLGLRPSTIAKVTTRDRREDTLRGLGHPEDEQDQAVTENQLDQIASGTGLGAGHWESMAWRRPAGLVGQPRRLSLHEPLRLPRYTSSSGVASSKVRV